MTQQALSGLKVLDFCWVVAGPLIGRALADFGATVVRIESRTRLDAARVMGPFPGGKPDINASLLFENCNAGKLGLTLDLSKPQGIEVARDLVAWADVVLESFAPGQMARWGLDYDTLRRHRPDLIMVSTSLMGQTGPHSGIAGFGNIGAAFAGFQALVGQPGRTPIGPYGPYTDYVGPKFALIALLAAVDQRRRTGRGCWIDVSQVEAAIQLLAPQLAEYSATGRETGPIGNRDPQFAPHGVFRCAGDEDQWIAIVARNDAEWRALARLIGGPVLENDARFASLSARKRHEDELEQIVSTWTSKRSASEAEVDLQRIGVAAHVVASSASFCSDPQIAALDHLVRVPHPVLGKVTVEGPRYRLSATPGRVERCAPPYGRDNEHILTKLVGHDIARIRSLEEAGVLQ